MRWTSNTGHGEGRSYLSALSAILVVNGGIMVVSRDECTGSISRTMTLIRILPDCLVQHRRLPELAKPNVGVNVLASLQY